MTAKVERTRFAVPLADLEGSAHVAQDDLVEELGKDPNPDVTPEFERRRAEFLKWANAGG